ncbi:MAG: BMP family ABC transporter substrate-binding protein [Bacillota bacterium]|nr:BMP family ABC transporter substrate-binding protein [Bacillota bacterium]
MLKWRRLIPLLVVLLLAAVFVAGCGQKKDEAKTPAPAGEDKMKVGFVYIGTPGDAGFTYAHEQGRKYLVEQLPYVETEVVENVTDADAERVITQLAEKGCRVIFTTSFGFMDPTLNVAKKYPDITFLHCSGYKTNDNMGTYFGRMYQARYLTGLVAGKMTKTNLIGYVAAFPIPEVVRQINAFTLGVRQVNPEAKVKVIWTNSWTDPVAPKDVANTLLDAGADVIAQHQDTPSPQQAAEARGKYSVGFNSDMAPLAPKAVLTSAVWNWGPYYVKTVEEIKAGTWKSGQYWGAMSDGIVDITPFGPMVPADVKQMVEAEKKKILSGEWDVFTGPIKDQTGKERVAAGQRMSDKELLEFSWFVEGVEGTIPQS